MTTPLIPGVGAGTLLESELLADDRSMRIGAIYRLDYHEAIVLTHDRWKFDAGGIPQYAFLLATASLSFLAMKIIFGVCAGGTWFLVGRLYYLAGVQRVGAYWWMWKRSARVDWASVISVIMRRAVGRPLVPSW